MSNRIIDETDMNLIGALARSEINLGGADPFSIKPDTRPLPVISLERSLKKLARARGLSLWGRVTSPLNDIAVSLVLDRGNNRGRALPLYSSAHFAYEMAAKNLGDFYTAARWTKCLLPTERKAIKPEDLGIPDDLFKQARNMGVRPIIGTRQSRFGRWRNIYAH